MSRIKYALDFLFTVIGIFAIGWLALSFVAMDFALPLRSPGSRLWALISILAAIGLFAEDNKDKT